MTLKIFHSKPSQSLKRSLVSRASVSLKFNIKLYFFSIVCLFPSAIVLTSDAFSLYLHASLSLVEILLWIMKKFDDGRVCCLSLLLEFLTILSTATKLTACTILKQLSQLTLKQLNNSKSEFPLTP